MASYRQIVATFTKINIYQNDLLTQQQLFGALDSLANSCGIPQYDRNVAEELWEETQKQNGNQVYLRDFIATVARGQELVKQSIQQLETQIPYKNHPQEKEQAIKDLGSYTQDLKYLTIPFGVHPPRQSRVLQQSGYRNDPNFAHNQSRYSNSTSIFARQIPATSKGSSTDLKLALLMTLALTFLQMIIMFHKHHFFSLMAYLSVYSIFILGYFDGHYLKFVKILLLVSVILDFAWLIVNFGQYWSPRAETQHSSLQWGFLKFIIFFMLGMMVVKILIAAILFKYRNNQSTMRRNVSLLGMKFVLNGLPRSPIALIANGNQINTAGQFGGGYDNTNGMYGGGAFANNVSGYSNYQNSR